MSIDAFDIYWDARQQGQIDNLETDLKNLKDSNKDEIIQLALRAEQKINMLSLINRAMWELMEDKLGLTMDQLNEKINEIDLRDGELDGKVTMQASDCPECGAKVNPTFNRCLFCGYEPEINNAFDKMGN